MTIPIQNKVDDNTYEYYHFKVYNFKIVFANYLLFSGDDLIKEWGAEERFNGVPAPHLPEKIRSEILSKVFELFRVMTYEEYLQN